jgi:Flp pilus assembly pilin Flp
MSVLNRFWNDESGPELVEWAVVTIILLVAAVVLYIAVGKILGGVICGIYCWLKQAKSAGGHDNATRMKCDAAEKAGGDTNADSACTSP